MSKLIDFLGSKYFVGITCFGLIAAGHWSWYRLQFVESLVTEEERKNLHAMRVIDSVKSKISGITGDKEKDTKT